VETADADVDVFGTVEQQELHESPLMLFLSILSGNYQNDKYLKAFEKTTPQRSMRKN
jgi:hypothetical protein